MSWSIGLHLGESVVEIAARDITSGAAVLKHRSFLSHGTPDLVFRQFIETHKIGSASRVQLVTALPLKIIDAAHGAPVAILTTAGFENWLEMSLPLKSQYFTAKPKRVSFLMDRQLIFGLSERVNAHSQVEKPLNEAELEFLVAKLQLHEIKNVAVGFMHSNRNPDNEIRAKEFLTARGFQVFLSSEVKGEAPFIANEKERLWTAVLNAYVAPLYIEKLKPLHDEFLKLTNGDPQAIFIGDQLLADLISQKVTPLSTTFSFADHLGSKFAQSNSLLYCGLEEILFFMPNQKRVCAWPSPIGNIRVPHWPFTKTRIQPLTKLGRGYFSELTYTKEKISFDPGPVVFGRGLVPSALDVLAQDTDFKSTVGISEKINEKGTARLLETLAVYARNLVGELPLDAAGLLQHLREFAAESWLDDIGPQGEIVLCGPLAPPVYKWLMIKKPRTLSPKVTGDDFFAVTSLLVEDPS